MSGRRSSDGRARAPLRHVGAGPQNAESLAGHLLTVVAGEAARREEPEELDQRALVDAPQTFRALSEKTTQIRT